MYQFYFQVEPTPWARARASGNRFFTAPKQRAAKEELALLMRSMWNKPPLDVPLKVEITFTIAKPKSTKRQYPCVKPDADNYAKHLLDCGNQILWFDDSLIVDLRVRKEYGEPSIKLLVGEV